MSQEENIRQALENNFTYLENKVRFPRPRRLFVDVDYADFTRVFEYAVRTLQFSHLLTITGLDEQDKLAFMYHLASDTGVVLSIKTAVLKDAPIKTVIGYFPGAEIYERELIDLLGAKVVGLPPGNRYPLTDDWPAGEFPLRKDWKPKK
jgi:NADH:ubiquinone oxidoreductase subunit C